MHLLLVILTHILEPPEALAIANKIWHNECGGKFDHLTCWNDGEAFASLGIGHFIWYPEGQEERFQQTFPSLLSFMQSNGVTIPSWLTYSQGCPWSSREAFYKDFASPRLKELRQWLYDTRQWQALFISNRLETTFSNVIKSISEEKRRQAIQQAFDRLANTPQGLYALIDYLNFKGDGTSSKERYQGQGWGLLQVLEQVSPSSKQPLQEFIQAAKKVLTARVENSPPEKNERRWLKGWLNRIDTYEDICVP